jgi:hypothetical protein
MNWLSKFSLFSPYMYIISILLRNVNQSFQTVLFPAEWLTGCSNHLLCRTPSGRSFLHDSCVVSTNRWDRRTESIPGLVKAVQNGKLIFVLMCSFQKPEPYQPSHAWPLPPNVPSPEECELQETIYTREAMKEGVDERLKNIYKIIIEVGLYAFLGHRTCH